jgi:hypothetical protein
MAGSLQFYRILIFVSIVLVTYIWHIIVSIYLLKLVKTRQLEDINQQQTLPSYYRNPHPQMYPSNYGNPHSQMHLAQMYPSNYRNPHPQMYMMYNQQGPK